MSNAPWRSVYRHCGGVKESLALPPDIPRVYLGQGKGIRTLFATVERFKQRTIPNAHQEEKKYANQPQFSFFLPTALRFSPINEHRSNSSVAAALCNQNKLLLCETCVNAALSPSVVDHDNNVKTKCASKIRVTRRQSSSTSADSDVDLIRPLSSKDMGGGYVAAIQVIGGA